MSDFSIRKNRIFASVPSYKTNQTEKNISSVEQSTIKKTGLTISETLQQLMTKLDKTAEQSRADSRLLRNGESRLAEVQERLGQMAEQIETANEDTKALQNAIKRLCDEIDQILQDGPSLFQPESADTETAQVYTELADNLEVLLNQLFAGATTKEAIDNSSETQALPDWLTHGMMQSSFDKTAILRALGLTETASSKELVAALSRLDLNKQSVAARLAVLYLGTVIVYNGSPPATATFTDIMDGLRQLLSKITDGVLLDQAIQDLTNGTFTSLQDFETQFSNGTAPNLLNFLTNLLLTPDGQTTLPFPGALSLLADIGLYDLDLLINAVSLLPNPSSPTNSAATVESKTTPLQIQQLEDVVISGADLSGISFDKTAGVLVIEGDTDVTIQNTSQSMLTTKQTATLNPSPHIAEEVKDGINTQSSKKISAETQQTDLQQAANSIKLSTISQTIASKTNQSAQTISASANQPAQFTQNNSTTTTTDRISVILSGSGTLTLQNTKISTLLVESDTARLFTLGDTAISSLELADNTSVTLNDKGMLRIGQLVANHSNTIFVAGGAVTIEQQNDSANRSTQTALEAQKVSVYLTNTASWVAQTVNVYLPNRPATALQPFDLIWKTFLPNWSYINAMEIDNKQTTLLAFNRSINPDMIRLWLDKEPNGKHGHPIHRLVFYGKDKSNQPVTRYAYLRWNNQTQSFLEIPMYPNPFTVTGGIEGKDWRYEEASHTLRILSGQVTGLAGGIGADAEQNTFNGRVAIASHIGRIQLQLNGVNCCEITGKAFDLGRENDVFLLLSAGTDNRLESGNGYAGLSIGDGTTLSITQETGTASHFIVRGGNGGAGIGRDSGSGKDQSAQILIQGGVIHATGGASAAGIGSGKQGWIGTITITGGTITATGGTGGAGIGGAPGALAGDISIQGGHITATASYHAAGIGAGVQGGCGDVYITGGILRIQGGSLGAEIGACVFGKCGTIQISNSADIGNAQTKSWTPKSISLQFSDQTLRLPRFPLSAATLHLREIDISKPEAIQTAERTIHAASRRISRIQSAYRMLHDQLEQNRDNLWNAKEYISTERGLIREAVSANALLTDTRRSLLSHSMEAFQTHNGQDADAIWKLLRSEK